MKAGDVLPLPAVLGPGAISSTVEWWVRRLGYGGASMIVGGVVVAAVLPHSADLVPAWVAFLFSIPFMTTVLPYVLGISMLRSRVDRTSAEREPVAVHA